MMYKVIGDGFLSEMFICLFWGKSIIKCVTFMEYNFYDNQLYLNYNS